jgi:hypothetical protein
VHVGEDTVTAAFPLNTWYAAAWPHEAGRALAGRTVCDRDLVLFRQAALTRSIQAAHASDTRTGLYGPDAFVCEAQRQAIARHPRRPFHNLNIGAGALWARRLIDRMIDAEHPPAAAAE